MYSMFVCTHMHKQVSTYVSHLHTGQFWNIPINVVHYTQPIDGVVRSDTYNITVNYPGQQRALVPALVLAQALVLVLAQALALVLGER